jgi:multiple sugar transport system permease protein
MSTVAITATTEATATVPAGGAWPAAQLWGVVLVVPYVLVFVVFVLYPVCYGFWIARRPETYIDLFDDPIFARTIVNTLVFLIVGINLKMVVALFLSNFFVQPRWWIRSLAVLFILPWAMTAPTGSTIRPWRWRSRSSPTSGNRCRSGP